MISTPKKYSAHKPAASEADPMRARFVPLQDAPSGHPIYDRSLAALALAGAALGGAVSGLIAYAIAEGSWPIAGLGQFAAAGWGVATFTGAGVGVALGGLAGGLIGVFRLPRPPPAADHAELHPGHGAQYHTEGKPGTTLEERAPNSRYAG